MKAQDKTQRVFLPLFGNVAMLSLGLAVALGLTEMLMRTFPNLLPPEVRVNPPTRRVKAFINETYELRQSDGDLFHYMRGKVMPLPPKQDRVVAQVHMVTDANGFRNSLPEKATYSIVALGDSFTRASGVAHPWPQKLAEYIDTDVFNLGEVAFGPQDELKVLEQYGLKKQPRWVILAFFGGNDLYDAAAYEQANPFILTRFGRYILDQGIESLPKKDESEARSAAGTNYPYPIDVTINKIDFEMAFFSYYVSWLSAPQEAIETSQNYAIATDTILRMRQLTEKAGADFLLVYVPSKEHVYLPYLKDPTTLKRVFADVPTIRLDEAGYLIFVSEKSTPELALRNMNNQGNLLSRFTAQHDINYLDLSQIFQEEAGTGTELYYQFDTHWNQRGHDLAAQAIARYLETEP